MSFIRADHTNGGIQTNYDKRRECFSGSFIMKKTSVGPWKFQKNVGNRLLKREKTVPFIVVETDDEKIITGGDIYLCDSHNHEIRVAMGDGS